MSELIHTTKKWLKYARHALKAAPSAELQKTLLDPVKWYDEPETRPPGSPPITDRATVARLLQYNYRALAEALCLEGKPAESFEYTYLSAAAATRAVMLWRKEPVNNPAVKADLERGRGNIDALCGLIAVNEWQAATAFAKLAEPIYYALLTGDDAFAEKLVSMLPDTPPADTVRREVYFTGVIFCKAVFAAILAGDAQALQAALEQRVLQYRAVPWDYSTVIDRVSAACIKIAQRRGTSVSLDIAEIPAVYLDTKKRASLHLPKMLVQ